MHFEIFEIFDILAGFYGYTDHSKFLMVDTTLVHGREHTIRVSMDLTYHFKEVKATFEGFLKRFDHFALFPW